MPLIGFVWFIDCIISVSRNASDLLTQHPFEMLDHCVLRLRLKVRVYRQAHDLGRKSDTMRAIRNGLLKCRLMKQDHRIMHCAWDACFQ